MKWDIKISESPVPGKIDDAFAGVKRHLPPHRRMGSR
jgi:hypothetical protein